MNEMNEMNEMSEVTEAKEVCEKTSSPAGANKSPENISTKGRQKYTDVTLYSCKDSEFILKKLKENSLIDDVIKDGKIQGILISPTYYPDETRLGPYLSEESDGSNIVSGDMIEQPNGCDTVVAVNNSEVFSSDRVLVISNYSAGSNSGDSGGNNGAEGKGKGKGKSGRKVKKKGVATREDIQNIFEGVSESVIGTYLARNLVNALAGKTLVDRFPQQNKGLVSLQVCSNGELDLDTGKYETEIHANILNNTSLFKDTRISNIIYNDGHVDGLPEGFTESNRNGLEYAIKLNIDVIKGENDNCISTRTLTLVPCSPGSEIRPSQKFTEKKGRKYRMKDGYPCITSQAVANYLRTIDCGYTDKSDEPFRPVSISKNGSDRKASTCFRTGSKNGFELLKKLITSGDWGSLEFEDRVYLFGLAVAKGDVFTKGS